jgi:hypothetical protein
MGATVLAYWPGITEDQNRRQLGFPSNDCAAWANWVVGCKTKLIKLC